MRTITRRALISGGVALGLGAAARLEFESLSGAFDHRTPRVTAAEAFARALAALDLEPAPALLHVAHSTHLLSLSGRRLLTDPWFYDPAHGGMRHARGPAVAAESLGPLDVVLITHAHPDHADPRALDRFDKRAICICGDAEVQALCKRLGFATVTRLQPWERVQVGPLAISATPAIHEIDEVGFAIEHAGPHVYFGGDTALQPLVFEQIRERFAPQVAILPVDGTRLRGDRRWVMTPEEAAHAARLLGVKLAIPSHGDAVFTDVVLRLWGESEPQAAQRLQHALQRAPGAGQRDAHFVRCVVPDPAALVQLS